ncbi:MAG: hypothetical protein BMS9Abin26_0818 [Gammaproteobacteria bacterium]|nr:MAG: hypothetical protein BMS9Abin26_0818 [Gammaproteobacteria bacterium]
MVFAYYNRLSRPQKKIYRQSDSISVIKLADPPQLRQAVAVLATSLRQQHQEDTRKACQQLVNRLTRGMDIPSVTIKVLSARPSNDVEELHGFYIPAEPRKRANITVWMRTAKRRQVVAFKTFLRTLLHELCHHLDYVYFNLDDSFHTHGFYNRENSLFRQLVIETG